ncbi:hypothetical protein H257_15439 [Aphanomyces astaci]|uniref:Uncharacterized protein n=1 Tax=Aphanomyces astaci TaxID=112090 RepID=W4FP88_APHAT|nr:hypothetical protein H257_15439 [Aphanomyces astaci]ETV68629.1 hypothetical protein H257_15439 [Aphanomyces astaci]|eukprot:XP_009841854.1 hypothetical protein H257_15439 [Aphanomyces astaci]
MSGRRRRHASNSATDHVPSTHTLAWAWDRTTVRSDDIATEKRTWRPAFESATWVTSRKVRRGQGRRRRAMSTSTDGSHPVRTSRVRSGTRLVVTKVSALSNRHHERSRDNNSGHRRCSVVTWSHPIKSTDSRVGDASSTMVKLVQ